jgi:hypothetical protein
MDRPPSSAERRYRLIQRGGYCSQRPTVEAQIFPNLDRTLGTIQIEHRLLPCPDHMNMGWAMIVWIDRHTQSADSYDCGHQAILTKPKRLGKSR